MTDEAVLKLARECAADCALASMPDASPMTKTRIYDAFIAGENDRNLGVQAAIAAIEADTERAADWLWSHADTVSNERTPNLAVAKASDALRAHHHLRSEK